jgi:hypothetical protein
MIKHLMPMILFYKKAIPSAPAFSSSPDVL